MTDHNTPPTTMHRGSAAQGWSTAQSSKPWMPVGREPSAIELAMRKDMDFRAEWWCCVSQRGVPPRWHVDNGARGVCGMGGWEWDNG
jgi:hypothetical protein